MAKWQNDLMLDAALDYLATATIMFVCKALPATYSDAATVHDLATHVMVAGDFSKDSGAPDGRELNIAQQASITVDHGGDAINIVLGISATSTLLYATSCTLQTLTAGNTVTVPAWIATLADAV